VSEQPLLLQSESFQHDGFGWLPMVLDREADEGTAA
jgi:hypothetical protein